MGKTVEKHFADWEAHVFGFGYGSGEGHVLPALRLFLGAIPDEGTYNHAELEKVVGPATAWLIINILCHADIIEYGTSPRFGWLTSAGEALRAFILGHSADELVNMTVREEDDFPCYPDICNCGPDGYSKEKLCHNPFWRNAA